LAKATSALKEAAWLVASRGHQLQIKPFVLTYRLKRAIISVLAAFAAIRPGVSGQLRNTPHETNA